MKISVVLPIYRTAIYLEELHERLCRTLEGAGLDFELLMVDDGSPDGAWPILRCLAARDGRVKAIRLSRNFGQHPAISAGFDHASGDVIVLMDADLQDRPEDIPTLLAALTDDVDAVYTIKQEESEKWHVRWTSRLYHSVISRLTHAPVPRNIGTYRLFTRRFLEALRQYPERNIFFGPVMFHAGFDFTTVPVAHDARKNSKSSYSFRKRLALAFDSLITYTDLPYRMLIRGGVTILAGSFLYSVAVLISYVFWSSSIPPGLTLIVLLLAFSLGTIMFSLGLIGSYVFRVYQEVLARPRYLVARALNIEVNGVSDGLPGDPGEYRRSHAHGGVLRPARTALPPRESGEGSQDTGRLAG